MQTNDKKNYAQQIAEVKQQAIAEVIHELHDFNEEGLRYFQESLHYCIYLLSLRDQEEELIPGEAKEHIHSVHILTQKLHQIELIVIKSI